MPTPDPNMRVSNAEREAIIARLHAATEEGRLELDEFADRSRDAYTAKTYGELERLLTDLPDTTGQLAVPDADPTAVSSAVSSAVRRAEDAPAELNLAPKASSVSRKGEWLVPRRIKLNSKASSVKLDFRHAVIGTREVDIAVNDIASSVELVLPSGAYAEDNVDMLASSVNNHCEYKGIQGLRFNVTGKIKAGSVTIRYERRFLWWRW